MQKSLNGQICKDVTRIVTLLRARPWEYLLFVDLMGHREDPKLARALKALERKALFLKVHGNI